MRLLALVPVITILLVFLIHTSANALPQEPEEPSVSDLVKSLKEENPKIRDSAMRALIEIGETAVPALVEALKQDDKRIRLGVVFVLAAMGESARDAIPALIEMLSEMEPMRDQDGDYFHPVGIALAEIGEPAIPALIQALGSTHWAAFALTVMGEPAVPALTQALTSEDKNIRINAAVALKMMFNWESIEDNELINTAVAGLVRALSDENGDVRENAASALTEFGGINRVLPPAMIEAVPALINALSDESPEVRSNAASALGDIGAPAKDAVPALIQTLKDEDESTSGRVAIALRDIGAKEAVPALVEVLNDENSTIRDMAANALGRIGGADVAPDLIKALDDKDPQVRHAVIIALGYIGEPAQCAIPALVRALDDKDDGIRSGAIRTLGKILISCTEDLPPDREITALQKPLDDAVRIMAFRGSRLLYTPSVNESEAKRLGQYLLTRGIVDETSRTLWLSRTDDTYQIRLIPKEGVPIDETIVDGFRRFAYALSRDVFGEAHMEIHLCDKSFKTFRTIEQWNTSFRTAAIGQQHIKNGEYEKGVELLTKAIVSDNVASTIVAPFSANGPSVVLNVVTEAVRGDIPEQAVMKLSEALGREAREVPIAAFSQHMVLATHYEARHQTENAAIEWAKSGIVKEDRWWVVGPFAYDTVESVNAIFPTESEDKPVLKSVYQGKHGQITWNEAADTIQDGCLDLRDAISAEDYVTGYAVTWIVSSVRAEAKLRFGSDDQAKVWLNGDLVIDVQMPRSHNPDGDVVDVVLEQGHNTVLVKICNGQGHWGFSLRVTDSEGLAVKGVSFTCSEPLAAAKKPKERKELSIESSGQHPEDFKNGKPSEEEETILLQYQFREGNMLSYNLNSIVRTKDIGSGMSFHKPSVTFSTFNFVGEWMQLASRKDDANAFYLQEMVTFGTTSEIEGIENLSQVVRSGVILSVREVKPDGSSCWDYQSFPWIAFNQFTMPVITFPDHPLQVGES